METTLIITANVIFLTWLYVQQKRLAAFERYCVQYIKVQSAISPMLKQLNEEMKASLVSSVVRGANAAKTAAESFKAFGESLPKNDKFHAC